MHCYSFAEEKRGHGHWKISERISNEKITKLRYQWAFARKDLGIKTVKQDYFEWSVELCREKKKNQWIWRLDLQKYKWKYIVSYTRNKEILPMVWETIWSGVHTEIYRINRKSNWSKEDILTSI